MMIREVKRGDGRGNMKEMRQEAKQTSGGCSRHKHSKGKGLEKEICLAGLSLTFVKPRARVQMEAHELYV